MNESSLIGCALCINRYTASTIVEIRKRVIHQKSLLPLKKINDEKN
jgi:hypothetical protein